MAYPHDTHPLFYHQLNINILNNLLNTIESTEFKKYVENKMSIKEKIEIKGHIDKSNKQPSSLYIYFKKNNSPFLHFSIHFHARTFNSHSSNGKSVLKSLIHFENNIKDPTNLSKYIKRKARPFIVIEFEIPPNKPTSLLFKLTPPETHSTFTFTKENIQDAQFFVNILNEYFDENNSLFLNNYYMNKHPNLNNVIYQINTSRAIRKNKGKYYNNINKTIKNKKILHKNNTPKNTFISS